MANSEPITGRCLCGAVRYEIDKQPLRTVYCHCRICQKVSGQPFAVAVFFDNEVFRLTRGEAKYYKTTDIAERGFCDTCGSRMFYRSFGVPWIAVDVGSLDHPEGVSPDYHTGVESQLPWITIDDDLPRKRTDDNPNFQTMKAALDQGND